MQYNTLQCKHRWICTFPVGLLLVPGKETLASTEIVTHSNLLKRYRTSNGLPKHPVMSLERNVLMCLSHTSPSGPGDELSPRCHGYREMHTALWIFRRRASRRALVSLAPCSALSFHVVIRDRVQEVKPSQLYGQLKAPDRKPCTPPLSLPKESKLIELGQQ